MVQVCTYMYMFRWLLHCVTFLMHNLLTSLVIVSIGFHSYLPNLVTTHMCTVHVYVCKYTCLCGHFHCKHVYCILLVAISQYLHVMYFSLLDSSDILYHSLSIYNTGYAGIINICVCVCVYIVYVPIDLMMCS